jgi:HNH endonuclease
MTRGCEYPRCGLLAVRGAYCHRHAPPRPSQAHYKTDDWEARRRQVLAEQPVCATPGCGRPAVAVDHIRERRDGGTDERRNLQGLCASHHAAKTTRRTHQDATGFFW